jgi:hypothetical protein
VSRWHLGAIRRPTQARATHGGLSDPFVPLADRRRARRRALLEWRVDPYFGADSIAGDKREILRFLWSSNRNRFVVRSDRVVRLRSSSFAGELHNRGLALPEAAGEDLSRAVDRWTFPLTGFELEPIEVSTADLKAERERRAGEFDWH